MLELVGDLGGVLEILILIFGVMLLPISEHSFVIKAISGACIYKLGDLEQLH